MKKNLLIIGGCRSGKSRFALEYANRHFRNRLYLATSRVLDGEMQERVRQHQMERGRDWHTVEEPLNIIKVVTREAARTEVILIDCITMWLSNMLLGDMSARKIEESVAGLVTTIQKADCSFVLVSNEVGAGIVPENRLARMFRDLVGTTNQGLAACAHEVYWLVAGLPVKVK